MDLMVWKHFVLVEVTRESWLDGPRCFGTDTWSREGILLGFICLSMSNMIVLSNTFHSASLA